MHSLAFVGIAGSEISVFACVIASRFPIARSAGDLTCEAADPKLAEEEIYSEV